MSIMITMIPNGLTEVYDASEKIGTELLSVLDMSYDDLRDGNYVESGKKYSCIIWIEDVEIAEAVEYGIETANMVNKEEITVDVHEANYDAYKIDGLSYVDVTIDDNASDEYIQAYIEGEREAAKELYAENNNSFVEEKFMARDMSVTYISQYSPCIFASLTISKICELMEESQVIQIEFWGEGQYEIDSVGESLSSNDISYGKNIMGINAAVSSYDVTGEGVKIGQIELSCPDKDRVFKNELGSTISYKIMHANTVHEIMYAIAPDATYYASAADTNDGMCEQIEWLLSQGVNIINMSAGNSEYLNTYTAMARWVDHIAFNHDVHFICATGNNMSYSNTIYTGVMSPAMAYNIISVGNVVPNTSYTIHETSSYNDDGVSRSEGRTYKPDIVAIGTYDDDDGTKIGTSFSAPMVAGTVALMCEYNPSLKTKQFVVKAILAASTMENYHNHVTVDENFEVYGAGVLNAKSALDVIYNGTYTASTGVLSSSTTTKSYSMMVSSSETNKRIALTYGNKIKFSTSEHNISDVSSALIAEVGIAVYAPNGTCVARCLYTSTDQWGANLKVIEFNPQLYGAGTYTIKVMRVCVASDGNTTSFGVAWK